jgi:tRNA U54 and U55 pseudouridine synthase Pus10
LLHNRLSRPVDRLCFLEEQPLRKQLAKLKFQEQLADNSSMETLANLAKILRRSEPTTAVRALREDVIAMLASDRATVADVAEAMERAVALRVIKSGDCLV